MDDRDARPEAVLTALSAPMARIVQGALESEGIPARIERQEAGAVYGLESGVFATRVLVPVDRLEEAQALIAELEAEQEG